MGYVFSCYCLGDLLTTANAYLVMPNYLEDVADQWRRLIIINCLPGILGMILTQNLVKESPRYFVFIKNDFGQSKSVLNWMANLNEKH